MCVTLALTWGGVRYAWVSVQVLVPLCLGVASIIFFFVIEAYWVNDPTVRLFAAVFAPTVQLCHRYLHSSYLTERP